MDLMQAVFVAPPGVHLLDISGPAHIFYEAQAYGAGLGLHYVSPNLEKHQKSSGGLVFSQLKGYDQLNLKKGDLLFIPGLDSGILLNAAFIKSLTPFFKWMVRQHEKGVIICSVCTGAFLVAESGLLNGLQCTTHWKFLDRFKEKFPKVEVLKNRLFVESKSIYSSAGVASGIDLALYVLEQKYGTKFASDIAREVVVYLRRGELDPQLSIFLQYRNHQEDRIHELQNWLISNLSASFVIEDLADIANTSPRNLTRLFKKTTGITIGEYVDKLRVENAVKLIGEGAKIEAVAKACGLRSSNQLRQILKKHTGLLPHDIQIMS